MHARMKNPALVLPNGLKSVLALLDSAKKGGVPEQLLELVALRTSQLNRCSSCVRAHTSEARKHGATDDQVAAVAAWQDAPYVTDAERAALALAEAVTRLDGKPDPVPDEIWDAAADHFDEEQLSALILMVATTNLFNRLNAAVKEQAGQESWAG